jgi:hypothetical protein
VKLFDARGILIDLLHVPAEPAHQEIAIFLVVDESLLIGS